MNSNSLIASILHESATLKLSLSADPVFINAISNSCQIIYDTIACGGTIYACGNGGSTCDAMHLVEELVGRYKRARRGIKAMHFMDPSVMTCWSNDESFDDIYRRQVEVFCTEKDALIAISTSGNSKNIMRAIPEAKARGTKVIGLTGKDGGLLAPASDVALIVPSPLTERIQEVHITIVHIWLELLETKYEIK